MKVAIVHYWLTGMRGGEKVLENLCDMYPDAEIFTLVADRKVLSEKILRHKIHTSFLQKIGGVKHYKKMLLLMPFALEAFDLSSFDLIISSEAGPAKGIIPGPNALHVCYCHSPMRYVWDLYPQYWQNSGRLARILMSLTSPLVRQWDVTTASRVDIFIANSNFVAKRIKKFYRRDAVVINPPVEIDRFKPSNTVGDYYLCAGQITPYKKIELAIEAFNRMGKKLEIVGSGVTSKLRQLAGPTISFSGAVDDEIMARKISECRALIFPGLEDFGIVPLEAQAASRPVIAFGKGGALETVLEGVTGVIFKEQTIESLIDGVKRFEEQGVSASPRDYEQHVMQFSPNVFKERIAKVIAAAMKSH